MIEDNLNKKIINWWQKLPNHLKGNLPTFIHPLNHKAKILFVGLNPSGDTSIKPVIENISEEQIKEKIELEKIAIFGDGSFERNGQYKKYYSPITYIADNLEMEFEHCDLFQMSYTKSREVLNEIFDSEGNLEKLHEEHLSVFLEVFNLIKPKVVIVNNVNSADILKKHLQLKIDETTGLYKNNTDVYFYLNGIMSYGRQTKYDRERLIWQIKKVL